MASRNDVVKAAKTELALGVKGRPNKYTKWYGMTAEWCAMFVSYVCNKAGVPTSVVPKTAAVATLYSFAKNNQRFKAKNSKYKPQGGDIMIQKSNGASHTGIVISSSGNTFTTIEGNSGDAVRQRSYTLSSASLTGFLVPAYTGSDSTENTDGDSTDSETVELCSTSVVSTVDISGTLNSNNYLKILGNSESLYELHIINKGVDYQPIVVGDVTWTTEWKDTAGKLEFTVLKDSALDIQEGNAVAFLKNGTGVFYGYLFTKSRNKNGQINCTAYDQLRYLKNKDTYCYKNKTLKDVVVMIAMDYRLKVDQSKMVDTKYSIPGRVEDNETLFDIIKNARELTESATGQMYILYDDYGLLSLKGISDLATDYLIDNETAEDIDYKTSIDDEVYNQIQFYRDDDSTGNRAKYIYRNADLINQWGVLQLTCKLENGDSPSTFGETILSLYSEKKRELTVTGCLGDTRLRAGASVFVNLDLGDVIYQNAQAIIKKAVHTFGPRYSCNLTLLGGTPYVG